MYEPTLVPVAQRLSHRSSQSVTDPIPLECKREKDDFGLTRWLTERVSTVCAKDSPGLIKINIFRP